MDIIGEYGEKQGEMTSARQFTGAKALPDGFLIRMVTKLSGGKIQDRAQALRILLIAACLGLVVAIIIVVTNSGLTQHPVVGVPRQSVIY